MKKTKLMTIVLLLGLCTFAQAVRPAPAEAHVFDAIILYVPNRVCDLMDIFRVRVRFGPGASFGLRATKPASLFAGAHSSFFLGLPGPRGEAKLPFLMGYDQRTGMQAGLDDDTSKGPYYDPAEVGLETQAAIVGVNVGIGFWEICDFLTGLVFIDLVGDDFGRVPRLDSLDEPEAAEPEA